MTTPEAASISLGRSEEGRPMLSEQERRELEIIERELRFHDPRFAARFARGFAHRFRRQLVRPRSVIVFGGLVMVAGIVLGLSDTFVQGLLVTLAGVTWWAWITRDVLAGGSRGARSRRR
jgi:Protein of unknown function (DUF3040)